MEKLINNKSFVDLRNNLNEVINQFKSIENGANKNIYDKYQLHQYDQIIEGNDEDVIQQYETMYDKFAEIVINKNNSIQQFNNSINKIIDMIEYLNSFVDKNDNNSIITKEMNNANTMIKCLNQLVDKILEKETTIFNKKEHKFGQQKQQQKKAKKQQIVEQKNQHRKQIFEQKNKKQKTKQIFEQQKQQSKRKFKQQKQQRKQEFEEKINDIKNMKFNYHNTEEGKQLQHIEEIKFENDNELKQLNNSIQSLIEWSGKQNYNVIFDSKIDGNGKGVLENKVMNKKNLYFISFDNHNNVFGGYVDTIINKTGWIKDINAFVFSLIRKGKVKNKKYVLKQNFEEQYAFI